MYRPFISSESFFHWLNMACDTKIYSSSCEYMDTIPYFYQYGVDNKRQKQISSGFVYQKLKDIILNQENRKNIIRQILKNRLADGLIQVSENYSTNRQKTAFRGYIENTSEIKHSMHGLSKDKQTVKKDCKIISNDWTDYFIEHGSLPKDTLLTKKGDPIGWHAIIPKNPKFVLIKFYGGNRKTDISKSKNSAYEYDNLDSKGCGTSTPIPTEDHFLIKNGVAIIKLNLFDIYSNEIFQAYFNNDDKNRLLLSLETFGKSLNNGHIKGLEHLAKIPKFIHGASFGGSIVINYLSSDFEQVFDGGYALSGPCINVGGQFRSDDTGWEEFTFNKNLIDLKKPVILVTTPFDNNVTLSSSITEFVKKAKQDMG